MRLRFYVSVCAGFLFLAPALAGAQDFGVLESAETINQGNIKLGVYPLITFPDPGDNEFILPVTVGYGLTDSLDLEGRAAFSDDVMFVGGDGEYWFLKNQPLDMSARGGLHFGFADGDVGDTVGFDASLIGSAPITSRLELIGALDMAFNRIDLGVDHDWFTTAHLVPGVEVAVTPDLDFLAEAGLGVTDESSNYVAFGLAFYIR